jgi:NADH-quinone oxidoreductase subunit I
MIIKRKPLSLWERLYMPAIIGGFKVTLRHFFKKKVTMQYAEEKWVVPNGYRGAPYLVRDQEGNTKCVSCQLCEFVCPPKAIKITPPGPAGQLADRPNAEKMPKEFENQHAALHFLRFLSGSLPGGSDLPAKGYSLPARTGRK